MSELSPETRALLEAGRHRPGLTPTHRDRLRGTILARAAGAAVVTTATSAAAWTSLGAKVIGGVVLVAATGAAVAAGSGAWTWRAEPAASEEAPAAPRAAASARPPVVAPPVVAPPERETNGPTAPAAVAAPERAGLPLPERSAPPQTRRAQPAAVPVVVAPAVATEPPESALPAARLAEPPPAQAVAAGTAMVPQPVTELAADGAGQHAAPPADPRLEQEVRLLRDADRAVKAGDFDRALLLLDRHAADFPHSPLEPERAAERVFALCRAGRVAQARTEAATFLALHPEGPLAVRVRATCR